MFAIIATGGKQYKVKEGQILKVEKLAAENTITFDRVLLLGGENVKIGTPYVEGAKVEAIVLGEVKGRKITIRKYKPKVRYRRKTGHRQKYTEVKIEKIVA